ncbi:MAG: SBBP repeat-containing protein, partial [Acidobacteria bacterium]|nr:SBBP repeat-containing protein [Acidobacteriota bacterium]
MTRPRRNIMKQKGWLVAFAICCLLIYCLSEFSDAYKVQGSSGPPTVAADGATEGASNNLRVARAYGKLPLRFEANTGHAGRDADFIARGTAYTLLLSAGKLKFKAIQSAGDRDSSLEINLKGADAGAGISTAKPLATLTNYIEGNDPNDWHTDIPSFGEVTYANVYPGTDVVYYSDGQRLEYDLRLKPGARPDRIGMTLKGVRNRRLEANGDLILNETVTLRKPVVYQLDEDGVRHEIDAGYAVRGRNTVGFRIAEYDRAKPLVIDPVLSYSKVIGGDGANVGNGIAVDASGNAYVVGTTSSNNFPTTNAFQAARGGFNDVFVMKLDPSGNVVYSTFLGGSNDDIGRGIAIDPAGNAYVTGWTFSTNFPVANAFQGTRNTSPDAFITKLSPSGSTLVYSTYIGGNNDDRAYAIATDPSGNAYITGQTFSSNFPTANAAQSTMNGTGDIFVTKMNAAGSALIYSTFLGGSQGFEIGNGIAADADGNAYVTGQTASTNFPT